MDEVLQAIEISRGRTLCVAPLSRQAVIDASAEHLGFEGFFIFEAVDVPTMKGINVLAKASSFDSALRLSEIIESLFRQTLSCPSPIPEKGPSIHERTTSSARRLLAIGR
jgi:hypothetical protein